MILCPYCSTATVWNTDGIKLWDPCECTYLHIWRPSPPSASLMWQQLKLPFSFASELKHDRTQSKEGT